jgi:cyclohexanecarboxyl-CoA dehydrogenase
VFDFNLSEEQEMFKTAVRDFTRKEIQPGLKERVKNKEFPRSLIKKMADMGLTGMAIPEEYGGQPASWVTIGLACEELAKIDFNASSIVFSASNLVIPLLFGTEEVKQNWLRPLATGDKYFCMGATEPDTGSDLSNLKTRAVKEGDHYVINGEKSSITYGMQADAIIAFAKTDPALGVKGITPFLVPLDLPGVNKSAFDDMGWEPLGRASIILDNVKVPKEYRLGAEGEGFFKVMHTFDAARALAGLQALGMAESSLENAINYAKERHTFGHPIATYQGVSQKLAEGATKIELGRWLCYRTLWMRDNGIRHTKESAMCKWWCPETALEIINNCLVIHGHIGFSKEYPIEQRLRDVVGLQIGDGPANIMKTIIARQILGREFVPA